MNRCKDCKNSIRDVDAVEAGYLECRVINMSRPGGEIYIMAWGPDVWVKPEFGCVLFESKEVGDD